MCFVLDFVVLAQHMLKLQQKCCGRCMDSISSWLGQTQPEETCLTLDFFVAKRQNPWFGKSVLLFRKFQPRWWDLSERGEGIGCSFILALGILAWPSLNVCSSLGPCCTPVWLLSRCAGLCGWQSTLPSPLQCKLWWWELTTFPFGISCCFQDHNYLNPWGLAALLNLATFSSLVVCTHHLSLPLAAEAGGTAANEWSKDITNTSHQETLPRNLPVPFQWSAGHLPANSWVSAKFGYYIEYFISSITPGLSNLLWLHPVPQAQGGHPGLTCTPPSSSHPCLWAQLTLHGWHRSLQLKIYGQGVKQEFNQELNRFQDISQGGGLGIQQFLQSGNELHWQVGWPWRPVFLSRGNFLPIAAWRTAQI